MERILTAEEMRSADKYNIEKLGVNENDLIERAGYSVAEEIINRLKGGRVLVCIGKGNNGKDGKVIANVLSKTHGFTVCTLNVYNGFLKMLDNKFDIIVDCIFGTGLNREVSGKYLTAINKINESGAYIVSCDIPSGLSSDTGFVLGASVKANLTIAIQEYKLGHFLNDGPDYCGKIILKDIGLSVWGENFIKRLNNEDVSKYFIKRKRNVNKGTFGKSLIIGGSKKYSGSSLLSKNALLALKTGEGYSYMLCPESLFNVYAGIDPECIIDTVKDKDGFMTFNEEVLNKYLKFDSISVGTGMGDSNETYKIICYLLKNYKGNLVIDADGLNALSKYGVDVLKKKKCKVILTPHVKEFSRLIDKKIEDVLLNFKDFVKDFAFKFNVTVILKSATSVISDGKEVFINTTGTNALAKAGSGDVLCGITVGLFSRIKNPLECATVSAYLLGLSGEISEKENNEYTVTATDVILALPKAINSL